MGCGGLSAVLERLEVTCVELLRIRLLSIHDELVLMGLIMHRLIVCLVDLSLVAVPMLLLMLAPS